MSDDTESLNKKYRKLVSSIYAGAMHPPQYADIFRAWDAHFEVIMSGSDPENEDFEWTNDFISHFEQAGEVFDKLSAKQTRPLDDQIKDMSYAALICSLEGQILAGNEIAQAQLLNGDIRSLYDILLDQQSLTAIKTFCQSAGIGDSAQSPPRIVVRLISVDRDEASVFLADIVDDDYDDSGKFDKRLLLRAITSAWDENIARALIGAFQLTQAELDLIENLYNGLTIKEISNWKERSQATLRKQLSSILQKTGTKSQADLLRIVSGLVQLLSQTEALRNNSRYSVTPVTQAKQRTQVLALADGTDIEVVETGDLDGIPFYFIQTSSSPFLTKAIADKLAERHIRLVSPMRSGLGKTTRKSYSTSTEAWARYHLEVIERLNVSCSHLGGHRCGGIYALELAKLVGSRCRKILLADTGAPLRSVKQIHRMPTSPKRLFLAARYFPMAVRTPYKIVTHDFYKSPAGEARLVEYFYDGSPSDQAIMHEGENWQITRDNIDYCLSNPFQAVQDVSYWSRDTSKLLDEVACKTHVRYFHGAENTVLHAKDVYDLCEKLPNTSNNIIQGRGQLLIYIEPDLFASEILSLLSN